MRAAIHELRNHLCVALAGIEALLDRKLEPSDARLNAIAAALREVELLIDDLPRDRAVTFAMHVIPIDVCRLIAGQLAAMEGLAAARGVRLIVDGCAIAHGADVLFLGDPLRIAEIVTNLLMNAIRYTPVRGEVRVWYRHDVANVRFCVWDEGPGIAHAERTHIFENGYRGATAGFSPGSGIGLALVKQFVECQGGTIVVSEGPARGAMFTVDLPGSPRDHTCGHCGQPPATVLARSARRPTPALSRAPPARLPKSDYERF